MNFFQGFEHRQGLFRLTLQAVCNTQYLSCRRKIRKYTQDFPGLLFSKQRVVSQQLGGMGDCRVNVSPGIILVCSHKNGLCNGSIKRKPNTG